MTSRSLVTLLMFLAATAAAAFQVRLLLIDTTIWPPDDFIEYWAAARLTLEGQNPYDESLLLPLQQAGGRDTQDAVMMWNPPWTLPAVLPLALLAARESQLLWLLLNFIVIGYCADRLWTFLGGKPAVRWVSWLIAFLFMPTFFALSSGQISPFLLLGVVWYCACIRRADRNRNWEYAAGAAAVLCAIKPHLVYLLWFAIALDALTRGRWRVIAGGVAAGLACSLLPLLFNPLVWHQYADAMGNRPPSQWVSPTIGTVLRVFFGTELFRLQFVSVVVGSLWFAHYWWRRRAGWNTVEQLPLLLLVSFVSAPYGAWPFDMVLLLPAVYVMVLHASAHVTSCPGRVWTVPRLVLAGLLAINLGCLILNLFKIGSFWFIWVSPAMLLLFVIHQRYLAAGVDTRQHPSMAPVAV